MSRGATFDDAWLAEHQARLKTQGGAAATALPDVIEFTLPVALRLLNRTQSRHWIHAFHYRCELRPLVSAATKPWHGHTPIERARMTVTRCSTGPQAPDEDNHAASLKPLIDLLLVRSDTHPHSFGLLRDDAPEHLTIVLQRERVATRAEQQTRVRIERC